MKRAEKDRTRTRTLILGFACLLWFTLLILRLVQLQVLEHGRHLEVVENQNQSIVNILPERGSIFDRRGTILATNIPARNIGYQPLDREAETLNAFRDKMNQLRKLLPRAYAPTRQDDSRVWKRVQTGHTFSYIVRQVPKNLTGEVDAARIPGIVLERTHKREYPQDLLFGRLVGWTNLDGKGQSGVELSYDSVLGGQSGQQLDLRDAHKRKFQAMVLKKPEPGKDVYLTVDETIQYFALRSLRNMMKETRAAAGLVIISDPSNGEILAMAEEPGYNPNLSHTDNTRAGQSDGLQAIRSSLEHGSTMKIATFAAAIEYDLPVRKQTFDCREGKRWFGRDDITDHKKLGILAFPDVFIHSSNVGTTMIADGLAHSEQYRMLETMGFGRPTGIDLPAEEDGIFPPLEDWDREKYKYAFVSIGYGFNATPLQVLQMVNIVANRGLVIPFRVVKDIPQALQAMPAAAAPYKRALSQGTADELTRLMQDAVRIGTGVHAAVPGYSAAGKTGTAQKRINGRYSHQHHIGSFVGFVPAENPQLSMIVVIDDPQGIYYGGDVAAPVFRDIAAQVLRHLGVPKTGITQRTLLTADTGEEGPVKLKQVLEGVPCVELLGDADCQIQDLVYVSRDVKQGGMFAALKGLKADGFDFIPDALSRGAVAVLCERNKPAHLDVNWVRAADAREALAHCAANLYSHPSQELTVVGVTGTKGKTTVTYLLESIPTAAGFRPGLLGTIEYRGPGLSITASRTTPEAPDLQRMMRTLRDNGAGHCVMEVSSHALSLKRAAGIDFDVAVFTNLSGDHLDYHRTMEEYFAAKSSLFSLGRRTMAVVNIDDPWGKKLIAHLAMGGVTYGFAQHAMVRVEHHSFSWDGIRLTLRFPAGRLKLESPLLGRPNLYNILAAVSAALTLNIPVPAVTRGIADVSGVKGRFQKIENTRGLYIFVDYAHTDDALRKLLETARELSSGRVLLVFGAGGDRDRSKRPRMGEAAGSLADWSILTSDNPRTEDPEDILAEVEKGILREGPDRYEIEPDRRTAIKKALQAACAGDTVLIAGKGHEDYQILGSNVIHFDDAEVIRELLHELVEESPQA